MDRRFALVLASVVALAAGCRSGEKGFATGILTHSVFPVAQGEMRMDDAALDKVLDSHVVFQNGMKVLIVDQVPYYGTSGAATAIVEEGLRKCKRFGGVVRMLPGFLPDKGGWEAIRIAAARHQAHYALLLAEGTNYYDQGNLLFPLYFGLVTIPIVPAHDVGVYDTIEAALLDVRTGVVLATASSQAEREESFVRLTRLDLRKRALREEAAKEAAGELLARLEAAIDEADAVPR